MERFTPFSTMFNSLNDANVKQLRAIFYRDVSSVYILHSHPSMICSCKMAPLLWLLLKFKPSYLLDVSQAIKYKQSIFSLYMDTKAGETNGCVGKLPTTRKHDVPSPHHATCGILNAKLAIFVLAWAFFSLSKYPWITGNRALIIW